MRQVAITHENSLDNNSVIAAVERAGIAVSGEDAIAIKAADAAEVVLVDVA